MKAPRPVVVIVLMFAWSVFILSQGIRGTGAEAMGYMLGAILFPALLAVGYVWWYRRRTPPG